MFTLITGATGGLGKAFVEVCAERKENMILTGRSMEKLSFLKAELLEKYPELDVRLYAADFADEESRNAAFSQMEKDGLQICRLINVAGADIQKAFDNYTQEKISFQCRATFEGAAAFCLFAIISQVPYYFLKGAIYLNILFTFILSLGIIYFIEMFIKAMLKFFYEKNSSY